MILSEFRKLAFVHVPKAAGTSLKEAVADVAPYARRTQLAHLTVQQVVDNGVITPDYTFLAAVRRPEVRALSLCAFLFEHTGAEVLSRPSEAIKSGQLFILAEKYTPGFSLSVWEMLQLNGGLPGDLHTFRVEDELGKLQELLTKKFERQAIIPHLNRTAARLSNYELDKEAKERLVNRWGTWDWEYFDYDL